LNGEHGHLSIEQIEHLLDTESDLTGKQSTPDPLVDARRHLADCDACKGLFSMMKEGDLALRSLKRDTPSQAAADCPEPKRLYELAAGLLDDKDSAELVGHVSECDRCGPMLREASEQLNAVPTGQEAALVASLRTSATSWQEEFGKRLALTASQTKDTRSATTFKSSERSWAWRTQKLTWALSGLAAILVLALIGGSLRRSRSQTASQTEIASRKATPSDAEALLATAYAQRRTLVLRIPGAQYAELQANKGGEQSELDKPKSLRKAAELIDEHRTDPSWLQAKARLELLDGNYNLAIQAAEQALDRDPHSASLFNDLGVAYFGRAASEEEGRKGLDYANSYECLSKALAEDPNYVVAWFNRAVVAELEHPDRAEKDWIEYFKLETDPAWRKEALSKREKLKQVLGSQNHHSQIPLDGPPEVVEALSSGQRARIDSIDFFADEYLRISVEQWIPELFSDRPNNRRDVLERALRLLGEDLRVRHGDSWLSDFVSESSFPKLSRPVGSLIRAIRATAAGDYERAIALSGDAEREFQDRGDIPGRLFAAFEAVYSDRLAARGKPCYEHAKTLIAEAHSRGYVWLEVQSRLEAASCAAEISRIDESVAGSQRALALARLSKYRNLQLRALMFAADLMGDVGKRLDLIDDGLRTFWHGRYEPMRGYSLYALLDTTADDLHLWFLDIATIQEGLRLIEDDPELATLCGMERYRLARAQLAIGDFDAAQRTSMEARAVFNRGSSKTLLVGASIDLAEAMVMNGNYQGALSLLDSATPEFLTFSQDVVAARYYSTRAAALLGNQQNAAAEPVLTTALKLAHKGFASISAERDRFSWSQSFEPVYRAFAYTRLQNDPESSLWWWESFRGASIKREPSDEEYIEPRKQKLPRFESWVSAGTLLLSYASLPSGIAVWTYDGQHVQSRMIPNSGNHLESLAHQFHDACADRHSDLARLTQAGKQLYELLISPVQASLQGKSRVIIEADRLLEGLPFEALVDEQGNYLGDSYEIEYSPGIFYQAQNTRREQIGNQDTALVVGSSLADLTFGLPPLSAAVEEAREVAAQFDHHKLLIDDAAERKQILQELPRADVFHFAGHAIGNQRMSALVLPPSHDGGSRLLDAGSIDFRVFRRARLVVLSACSTANGVGIGINDRDSLARNALAAGVPRVVASRWLVDSVASREWMKVFYQNVVAGRPVSECARRARNSLKSNPQWRHPFFWSAFSVFV
jgi:CHAT domain-containing protein/Flp pilus assembly protein TadD